jgi:ethanolamine ammonia-lyase small subunit
MDAWNSLRQLTSARIAIGRTGGSVLTRERLDFLLAHARARDAVLAPFDADSLARTLHGALGLPVLIAASAAADRSEYLQRPDLGRRLAPESRALLAGEAARRGPCDIVIVISDGLSTLAALTHTGPLLAALLPLLAGSGWTVAPLLVARYARVAFQDEAGEILRARISLMLIGERPGLGSADSLGAYFTYRPEAGKTDADRNCISNIRQGGLAPADAARKLHSLLTQSRRLALSGVRLKDDGPSLETKPVIPISWSRSNSGRSAEA